MLHRAAASRQTPAEAQNTPAADAAGNIFGRLRDLYARMEQAYEQTAAAAGLTCNGCQTNCCTSFFQHHTYVEWAYLWRGLQGLAPSRRKAFVQRAEAYVREVQRCLTMNVPPSAVCPLNEDGLCALYAYRLMICRMHGTRNVFTLPDGRQQVFPGCARFVTLPCAAAPGESPEATAKDSAQTLYPQPEAQPPAEPTTQPSPAECPTLDRTPFYKELAELELALLRRVGRPLPRVNLTLAEMIVQGPPKI